MSLNVTLASFGDLTGYLFMGKFGSNFNQKKMYQKTQILCFFIGILLLTIYLLDLRQHPYMILLECS